MRINKRKILQAAQKHFQKGNHDKALEEYQKLLKADPKDTSVRLKVGDIYLKLGRNDDAISAYLRVAEQFMNEGFDAKAVALYKQVTKLDPKRHDVWVPLAELYQRMGLMSDAMAALQVAADAAYKAGEKDDALHLLQKMAALDPSNTGNRLKVADLLQQEGHTEDALAEYDAVVEELERQGDDEERLRVLERAFDAAPERTDTARELVRALLGQRTFDRAEVVARKFVAEQPEDLEAREMLGLALEGKGERDACAEVMRELAEMYRERGDDDKSRDLVQRYGVTTELSVDRTDEPALETDPADDGLSLELDTGLSPEELSSPGREFEDPGFSPEGMRIGESLDGSGEADIDPGLSEDATLSLDGELPLPDPDLEPDPEPAASAPEPPPAPAAGLEEPAPVESPEDPEQLLAEAGVFLRYGKHERAIEAYRGVLAAQPANVHALLGLGDALLGTGEDAHATTAFERAAQTALDDSDMESFETARARLADLGIEVDAVEESPSSEPELPEGPEVADAADSEIAIDTEDGVETEDGIALDDGLDLGDVEIEIDPGLDDETPEPTAEEAAASESASDAQEDVLDVGLDLDHDDLDLLADDEAEPSAVASASESEPAPGAEPTVEASAPSDPPLNLTEDLEEADFYFEQGLFDEAREAYQKILEVAPNHPQAQLRLGEIEAAAPQQDPAPEEVVVAPASMPEEPDALEHSDGGVDLGIDPGVDLDIPEDTEDVVPHAADSAEVEEEILEDDDDIFEVGGADVEPEPASGSEALEVTAPVAPDVEAGFELVFDDETPEPVVESAAPVEADESPVDEPSAGELPAPEPDVAAPVEDEVTPPPGPSLEEPLAPALGATEDGFPSGDPGDFDLAAELSGAFDAATSGGGGGSAGVDDEGFEQVFAAFKQGVQSELGESDHEAHYDLGIAYKEMGLLEDAIGEFQQAMANSGRQLSCLHMMGLCALDLGRVGDATAHLEQALSLPEVPDDQLIGLRFDLGRAFAVAGDVDRARASFEAVRELDPEFPGVEEELVALAEGGAPTADASEEAFESFDDLLEDGESAPEAPAAAEFESFDDLMEDDDTPGPAPMPAVDAPNIADVEPAPADAVIEAEPADDAASEPDAPKRRKRKKISFV